MFWKQIAVSGMMELVCINVSIIYSLIFFMKKYTSEITSKSPLKLQFELKKNVIKYVR